MFSTREIFGRVIAWRNLVAAADKMEESLPSKSHDAFFELIGYPIKAAAAMNEKCLIGSKSAAEEIHRLTDQYNKHNCRWQMAAYDVR